MNYNVKSTLNSNPYKKSMYWSESTLNTDSPKFVDNIDYLASKSNLGWEGLSSPHDWDIFKFTKNATPQVPDSKFSSNFQDVSGVLTPEMYSGKLLIMIKNSHFDDGETSAVDNEIRQIFDHFGEDYILKVLNFLWQKCFVSENQTEHAYFLNCIRNISFYMIPDVFVPFACSAISHKNIMIKEAGIATFEAWDDINHKGYLENIDTFGQHWLEEYKHEVMENLGT